MKKTGIDIQEALRKQKNEKTLAESEFNKSLWAFEDTNVDPLALCKVLADTEGAICFLETLQQKFNLATAVHITTSRTQTTITLAYAIKFYGVCKRYEALWLRVLNDQNSGYGFNTRTRSKDDTYATKQIPDIVSKAHLKDAMDLTSKYKVAIAQANLGTIDVEDGFEWLFT